MALRAICDTRERYDGLFQSTFVGTKEFKGVLAVNPLIEGDEVIIANERYVYENGELKKEESPMGKGE